MDSLDDNVLKLILQTFDEKAEAFFLRTVCKRWASLLKPNTKSYIQIARQYAEYGSRSALEYFNKTYSRYRFKLSRKTKIEKLKRAADTMQLKRVKS